MGGCCDDNGSGLIFLLVIDTLHNLASMQFCLKTLQLKSTIHEAQVQSMELKYNPWNSTFCQNCNPWSSSTFHGAQVQSTDLKFLIHGAPEFLSKAQSMELKVLSQKHKSFAAAQGSSLSTACNPYSFFHAVGKVHVG